MRFEIFLEDEWKPVRYNLVPSTVTTINHNDVGVCRRIHNAHQGQ